MNTITREAIHHEPHAPGGTPHHASQHHSSNGDGTVQTPRHGATQDRPVLDGATAVYGDGPEPELRFGMDHPELFRHAEPSDE